MRVTKTTVTKIIWLLVLPFPLFGGTGARYPPFSALFGIATALAAAAVTIWGLRTMRSTHADVFITRTFSASWPLYLLLAAAGIGSWEWLSVLIWPLVIWMGIVENHYVLTWAKNLEPDEE
ncbi:hypothetical protein H7347_09500 [Corynebacterium sp. zg-331]|uniref:hypothetical protein n=1 Tax=unclassified Corynebacterium TaxID=2624378 RepID=UPI00128D6A1F|nr:MULTISPECIES: hypothetical protein [unclassified Corynebacterium]MBC3186796.1 hypothetical protein [Corynebacterium sp. zg-331]MPV53277.1 hypothetical protein [Corynebacterium sp. zg331]